jgi:pilus assembly protein CpaB
MNMKTTIPLVVAVVLGLVAAIVASQLIKQRPVAQAADGQAAVMNLTEVVVAARDIAPGTELTTDDLRVMRIEAASAPQKVVVNPSAIFKRVAKLQIPAGQILHESLLAESGAAAGLPGVIPPGFRAMTIEINEFTGVAGLLEPGNHIDVLARVSEPDNAGQSTRTIVQNIPILAVGASLMNKQATGEAPPVSPIIADAPPPTKQMARSVTLLVTPEDAEKIDLATSTNNARIVLRASSDTETVRTPGATLSVLRGDASQPSRSPFETQPASVKKSPADGVFGGDLTPVFQPKSNTRSITVVRAGVTTTVDVDVPETTPADEQSTPRPEGTDAAAGGGDMTSTR